MPPHIHRENSAERDIQTFKKHVKPGLASLDPDFMLSEWDRLINQAEITLNLLRSARLNSNLLSYTYICGESNYNPNPIAPPGTRIIDHSKPSVRES